MSVRVRTEIQTLPRTMTVLELVVSHTKFVDRYFLDESGHSGDLASTKELDFSGQPVFALACIGVGNETELVAELDRLRTHYRCGTGELKSSALGRKLPGFASDLVTFLVERSWPLFIELVEKRFFIAIHIVNHLLCGRYTLAEVDMSSRNLIAEFLADEVSDEILLAYLEACRLQSVPSVAAVIDKLWNWLDLSDAETARTAQVLTLYARDRVRESSANAEDFLPIADETEFGKKIWMLPNLQCLTNIYARLNLSRKQGIEGTALIHDEQMQYAKVLLESKALMEQMAKDGGLPIVPFADYKLRGKSGLRFATAQDEPCLQAADILAGCAMRFAREGLRRNLRVDSLLRLAFDRLIQAGNPMEATGVNLVMSQLLLRRLNVPFLMH